MGIKDRIKLKQGDITAMDADAVVNAANTDLILGAGVAGAIRRAGGAPIQEECDRIGPILLGEAAITSGGNLKARFVIHAASMSFRVPTSEKSLADSTKNSLLRADEKKLKSIAFPAIGTGVAGFPLAQCARLMIRVVIDHLKEGKSTLETIWFVLYDDETYRSFKQEYDLLPND